jgi:hypothetical protein
MRGSDRYRYLGAILSRIAPGGSRGAALRPPEASCACETRRGTLSVIAAEVTPSVTRRK